MAPGSNGGRKLVPTFHERRLQRRQASGEMLESQPQTLHADLEVWAHSRFLQCPLATFRPEEGTIRSLFWILGKEPRLQCASMCGGYEVCLLGESRKEK